MSSNNNLILLDGLPSSPAEFGTIYSPRENVVSQDILMGKAAVNESSMSVRARISTDDIDREGMIVANDGIRLDLYVHNPVVLFGHGIEGIPFPIAMAETPEGECTITKEADGTYGVAYFQQSDKLSSQMFGMISCGLLRALSIGATPLAVTAVYLDGEKIPKVTQSMLNEYSFVAIGVNPFALKKSFLSTQAGANLLREKALQDDMVDRILRIGRIDGVSIHSELRKSLRAIKPIAKGNGVGSEFAERLQNQEIAKKDDGSIVTSDEIRDAIESPEAKKLLFGEVSGDQVDVLEGQIAEVFAQAMEDSGKKSSIERSPFDKVASIMPMGSVHSGKGRVRWKRCSGYVGQRQQAKFIRQITELGWTRLSEKMLAPGDAYGTQVTWGDEFGNRVLIVQKYGFEEIDNEFGIELISAGGSIHKSFKGSVMKRVTSSLLKSLTFKQLSKAMGCIGEYDERSQGMIKAAFAEAAEEEETELPEATGDDMDGELGDDMGDLEKEANAEEFDDSEPAMGPEDELSDSLDELPEDLDEETTETEVDGEGGEGQKLGSQVINSTHADLSGVVANIEAALQQLEKDEVIDALKEVADLLRDQLGTLENLHNKLYSDQPGPAVGASESEVSDELFKSWVSSDRRAQGGLEAVARRLEEFAKFAFVPDPQRRVIQSSVRDLNRLGGYAKSFKSSALHKPKEEPEVDASLIAELEQQVIALNKQIEMLNDQPE